ncbi:serine hydrolase [Vagococcus sp.]|uniref:serine hydrolase n=1 Tax=Vagococcus sp. TaxID=1933889 RepID=UPI003F966F15
MSDPAKGYIQKNKLEPRKKYKEARERHRVKKLTKKEFKQKLDKELQQFVKEKGGEINLFVETVDEKFTYSFYGDEIKRTASSIKLPFIAYLMELVDEDEVQLDTKLTYTSQFKIDGTGIIQFEPFGKEYTIKELAELTIRYSDNVAYLMLLNYLGEQNFIDYLGRLDEKSPNNRAFSSARILTQSMKMVNELKKDNPNMKLLDQWLQESIFDDGVAIGIPSVDVNHKTGWMPMYTVSTDVALVKDKKNPYYLTIMTTGYDVSYSEQVVGDIAEIIDRNMLELAL